MRMWSAAPAAVALLVVTAWAAGPAGTLDAERPVFRVTTAEVHLTFTAVGRKNQPVGNLSQQEFELLRDGRPVQQILSFSTYTRQPLHALVLTDISDSMERVLFLERIATRWLRANSDPDVDRLSFIDFGAVVQSSDAGLTSRRHVTSLYDSLAVTLQALRNEDGPRPSLILLSDGIDNYSMHTLDQVISLAQRYDVSVYAITAHLKRNTSYSWDVLQRLCEETGGRYYEVAQVNAMQKAIADIADQLRSGYELVFRPGGGENGMHRLAIRAKHGKLKFFHRTAYYQPATAQQVAAVR